MPNKMHPRIAYFRIDPDLYRELRIVSLQNNIPIGWLLCGAARHLSECSKSSTISPIIALAIKERENSSFVQENKLSTLLKKRK